MELIICNIMYIYMDERVNDVVDRSSLMTSSNDPWSSAAGDETSTTDDLLNIDNSTSTTTNDSRFDFRSFDPLESNFNKIRQFV